MPIEKIYKGLGNFDYEPKKDGWHKYLSKGKSTYQKDLESEVKVKCIKNYYDIQLKKNITTKDEPYLVNKIRAEELIENEVAKEVK